MNGFGGDVVVFERTDQNDLIERQVCTETNPRILQSNLDHAVKSVDNLHDRWAYQTYIS